MEKVRILAIVLAVALAISASFNVYLTVHNPDEEWTKTFAFCWSPEEQNITDGILWMNFTFKTLGENLSITVKINDDDYNLLDLPIFVFDKNQNGKIDYWCLREGDVPFLFSPSNLTNNPAKNRLAVGPSGEFGIASSDDSMPSPWHTCFFSNEGYTLKIDLPQEMIGGTGILYVIYFDYDAANHQVEDKVYLTFSYLEDEH